MMCLGSQLMKRKLTIVKILWAPFDIQRSKMHVANKHSANASFTCFIKVSFTNARNFFSMKTFLHGKFTLEHNQKVNMWNQTNSTIFSGRKPLMINNVISSKKSLCISWVFENGFEKKKKSKMEFGVTWCHLAVGSQSKRLQRQTCTSSTFLLKKVV